MAKTQYISPDIIWLDFQNNIVDIEKVEKQRWAVCEYIRDKHASHCVYVWDDGKYYNQYWNEMKVFWKLSNERMQQLQGRKIRFLTPWEFEEMFCPF